MNSSGLYQVVPFKTAVIQRSLTYKNNNFKFVEDRKQLEFNDSENVKCHGTSENGLIISRKVKQCPNNPAIPPIGVHPTKMKTC